MASSHDTGLALVRDTVCLPVYAGPALVAHPGHTRGRKRGRHLECAPGDTGLALVAAGPASVANPGPVRSKGRPRRRAPADRPAGPGKIRSDGEKAENREPIC